MQTEVTDWLDSGFNTEDCSRLRTQFRNLKSDKTAPSIGIWPKIHLEPSIALLHEKVWEASPHWLAVKRILVAMAPSRDACFSFSVSPGRSHRRLLSRTSSGSAKSLTRGEVLDLMTWKQLGEVSSHCLCVYTVPNDFIFGTELTIGCTQCM